MTSRKRRAEGPASSPRSYKQRRLGTQGQNTSSQPPDKMKTKLAFCFNWAINKVPAIVLSFWPRQLSTKDETPYEEYTVETTPVRSISPERIRKQRHESVRSPTRINFSTIEEGSPIPSYGPEGNLQSTPKGHHASSSSITTTYSNTQPSSFTEDLLVESINSIQLDSSSSLQSSQVTSPSFSRGSTAQSKDTPSISRNIRFRPRNKPHIEHRKFKATVRERNREALKLRMYQVNKHHRELVDGHGKAMNFADYQLLLQHLDVDRPHSCFVRGKSPRMLRAYSERGNMQRIFDNAKATLNSPKIQPFTPPEHPQRALDRIKDADIEARLRGIPNNLPPKEEEQVDAILRKRGVVAKFAREQVSDVDVARLGPGQWLNDEIVNFYGAMILARSKDNKENAQVVSKGGGNGSLDIHYFSTFFWTKLIKEGYERGRLAKWTKKIDIFSKDVILIPINHSNAHWTAAAINFRKKRIESYDSMGVARTVVFTHLRAYVDAEHRDKRKKPFDFTGWVDIAPEDTPQQANGWDCGVFTCHFLEAISRGVEDFSFHQVHMPYLRRRMIWELGNAELRSTDYK